MILKSLYLSKYLLGKYFPVRTEQASSIKFLLLRLYFEFPADGTAHLIGDNARATIRRENLFLLRHFRSTSAKIFGQTTKKGFYLTSKSFLLNFFSRTQISEFSSLAVHLSGSYNKIRTAQGTNQNALFHLGPVQSYNNEKMLLCLATSSPLRLSQLSLDFDRAHAIETVPEQGGE